MKNPLIKLEGIGPKSIGRLYADSALLSTYLDFIMDSIWLKEKSLKDSPSLPHTELNVEEIFNQKLKPLACLSHFIKCFEPKLLKSDLKQRCLNIEDSTLLMAKRFSDADRKLFLIESLTRMADVFFYEEELQRHEIHGPCLYRCFEKLDTILGIDYKLENREPIGTTERLYQGSGSMVQSGYSTIILSLHHANLPLDSRVIDLGSGYGRVGFVFTLLRPDIFFEGYEYIEHRIMRANETSKKLGLKDHLKFLAQDLSQDSFLLPEADAYYLYDPFTEKTYQKILSKLISMSQKRKIIIITKGNARRKIEELAKSLNWPSVRVYDGGNLCLFHSS